MGSSSELYQSVLQKLSLIPVEYLQQVDDYLAMLNEKANVDLDKKERARKTMSLAGSWSDMSDKDFNEYMDIIKQTKKEMFSREVNL